MNFSLEQLSLGFSRTVFFRSVLEEPVMHRFRAFIELCAKQKESGDISQRALCAKADAYSAFLAALYVEGGNLGAYLNDRLECDDNTYYRLAAVKKEISHVMRECFMSELAFFSSLTHLTPAKLFVIAGLPNTLPGFDNTLFDFSSTVPARLAHADTYGYGIYAKYGMFRVDENARLVPVPSPDPITLSDLIGYESERDEVIANTKALIEGRPAANVLLCGDAGTGKSSTVKAVANRFRADGVRLVELRKEQLVLLPEVMGEIADNPLKFILFVDDMSFAKDDDGYASLKAALEGSASVKAANAVIYATSNRRHLVKETFSSREGDEIHRRDAIEELMSLSERFGLTVLFSKPNKELYLQIVSTLVKAHGLTVDESTLTTRAEAFALAKGGRSARVAEQFVDSLMCKE